MIAHLSLAKRIILSCLILCFGIGILVVSLQSHSLNSSIKMNTQKPLAKLFLGGPLLPGNPLYTFLMIRDKVQLWTTPEEARLPLYLRYAGERLQSAEALFQTQEYNMGISTITKGQIYIGKTVALLENIPLEKNRVFFAKTAQEMLKRYYSSLIGIKDIMNDGDRVLIDKLLSYNLTLQDSTSSFLK